jgi:hypothetical protein
MRAYDRKTFFEGYRAAFGRIRVNQVKPLEFLLRSFEADSVWADVRHVAYALATIKHETADTFEPITEYGSRKYFDKYDVGNLAKRLGNTPAADGDGFLYRGRGYVQLTGRTNYERFGIDDEPEKALEPQTAFEIMSVGMFHGSYTGKKLTDYIKSAKCDYRNARRVINGTDKAAMIAGYATEFEEILKVSAAARPVSDEAEVPPEASTTSGQTEVLSVPQSPAPPTNSVEVSVTPTNEQSVTAKVVQHGPEPYQGVGFWGVIKRDLTLATGGNLSFEGLSQYAQQASGWPEWVVAIIGKAAVGALIATVGYFIFRVVHYLIDSWKQNQRTKLLAEINTDTSRKDLELY